MKINKRNDVFRELKHAPILLRIHITYIHTAYTYCMITTIYIKYMRTMYTYYMYA